MARSIVPLNPEDFSGDLNNTSAIPEELLLKDATPESPWVDNWRRTPHGSWEFRFMMDGERHQEDTFMTDKRKAEKFLLAFKSGILQRKKLGIKPTPTFAVFKIEYLNHLKAQGYEIRHISCCASLIEKNLAELDGLLLNEIDERVVDRVLTNYELSPRLSSAGKPRMVSDPRTGEKRVVLHNQGGKRRLAATLNAMMAEALRRKYLFELPFEPRKVQVDEKEWTVLTREQVDPFLSQVATLQTCDYPWEQIQVAVACHMMLLMGLRESETTSAIWTQVTWGRNLFIPTDTKNFKVQPLPMGKRMSSVLEEYWVKCGKPRSGLIFPLLPRPYEVGEDIPKDRTHPRGWTYRTVRKAGESLGLSGLSPHRLRNSFATLHAEMGTNLLTLRRLLRHHSLLTTEKYIMRTMAKGMHDQLRYEDWIGLDGNSDYREELFGSAKLPEPIQFDSPESAD